MRICAAALGDQGRVRERNDDHFCLGAAVGQSALSTLTLDGDSAHFRDYGVLAAVADGMGGYAGGALASRVVLETLSAQYYAERRTGCTPEEFGACLQRYLEHTRQELVKRLSGLPEMQEAGTTLAGIALMPPDLLAIFHAGDSRVLRASAGYVRQLTVDHTPIGADLASGRLSDEDAAAMPGASQLTRALGLQGDTRVEMTLAHRWRIGDTFLLGTDGWHGAGRGLPRKTIQTMLREGGAPEAQVSAQITEAVRRDGHDNAMLVLVAITGGSDD